MVCWHAAVVKIAVLGFWRAWPQQPGWSRPSSHVAVLALLLPLGAHHHCCCAAQVFYAPHIAGMSSAMGTRFQPIRYTLKPNGDLVSNVRYSNPLLGKGWLSASGGCSAQCEGL